jgi:hypothetical protein
MREMEGGGGELLFHSLRSLDYYWLMINASWMKLKRRWDEAPGSKNKNGHPVMMIGEDGKQERMCYGCGQVGHLRGAAECKASEDAVWGGAPKSYLDKVQKKFEKTPMPGKRPMPDEMKRPCKFHAEGFCK